ncbi:BsuBI/PstI family type II restriction endonuclease [Buchananella felis]|uniref:BsuBI/PstI family type II restriction endonuclease n=1 Tax=Buchananella felis TaxID=3231492 RepID=UPI00352754BE
MNQLSGQAYDLVEDARHILELLGMDRERSNERSALVLLALSNLSPGMSWAEVESPLLGTRAIMDFMRDKFAREYAPNTRETVRRFTLHQFVEVGIVVQNVDDPQRPVNSPYWNYSLSMPVRTLLASYGSDAWQSRLRDYLVERPGLIALYAAEREMEKIPVALPDGDLVALSPGGQNELIRSMVEEFCPRYAPGGVVLYVGDADSKWAIFAQNDLKALGVDIDRHGKMPDLVVYLPDRGWLLLMEAVISHGPVDAKRKRELEELFVNAAVGLVFVSCFPSRAVYRRYADKIAWESEVWFADEPTHMLHFNGERFLGPYD